ncbi:MAG: alanine:cation symporter family protein, partial [Rhodospirillales bacterium]|nr:alanine:cation symporter family protein [Rhodospirillales bacterium]
SGIGIAPFWQGANRGDPAKSALLAAAVPLTDTLIICTTTGLVVLTADQWLNLTGAYLTVTSFSHFLGNAGRMVVTVCLVIFAFTTIINWAHFSERCFQFLGGKDIRHFRWFFAAVTFVGPFLPLRPLWSLGDLLIGLMLIVHLIPLTYIVVRHSRVMCLGLLTKEEVD